MTDSCFYMKRVQASVYECRVSGRKGHRPTSLGCQLGDRQECARRFSGERVIGVGRPPFIRSARKII